MSDKTQKKPKKCAHLKASQYFGPVYMCPDCGEFPMKDICKPGRQWRN